MTVVNEHDPILLLFDWTYKFVKRALNEGVKPVPTVYPRSNYDVRIAKRIRYDGYAARRRAPGLRLLRKHLASNPSFNPYE